MSFLPMQSFLVVGFIVTTAHNSETNKAECCQKNVFEFHSKFVFIVIQKVRTFAFYYIGIIGLPLPSLPIYAESPHS